VLALALTGRLGSGKTAVAAEVQHHLEERGLRSAAIDLDWLCWVGPDLDDDTLSGLLTRNLRAVVAGFAGVGVTHVVMARALLSSGDREAVEAALPLGSELTVVRLEVDATTVALRLDSRDQGAEQVHVAAIADEISRLVASADVEDHVVDNGARPLAATAADVVALWLAPSA
jgi:hypothetical protein